MYRAASYLEKNELYKSEDYIAPRLLRGLIKFPVKHKLINYNWMFPPFNLIQNLNSEDLEKMFFGDEHGNIMAKINGTLCIAHLKK